MRARARYRSNEILFLFIERERSARERGGGDPPSARGDRLVVLSLAALDSRGLLMRHAEFFKGRARLIDSRRRDATYRRLHGGWKMKRERKREKKEKKKKNEICTHIHPLIACGI